MSLDGLAQGVGGFGGQAGFGEEEVVHEEEGEEGGELDSVGLG